MPFNGSGIYEPIPAPDFPAVPLSTIRAAQYNAEILDIAQALGQCLTRTGEGPALANIPMGGFQLTGLGVPSAAGQALVFGQDATVANLAISGSGKRITGDFSNATVANRVMFQTSTVNGNTIVSAIPNGTGTQARFDLNTSAADPQNASTASLIAIAGAEVRLQSAITGAGSYLPMAFYTGGAERLRIDTAGNVLALSPSGGLGYGTGAGGTVTQATSKGTAVTLNKPCGQITMHNASLAGGASVQFTLNNSLLLGFDNLFVTANWSGSYSAKVVSIGTGGAAISVKNETGGALSDALVLNFVIIKGVLS